MTKAGFIEPMLLLRTNDLPDGAGWLYKVKFDGFRAVGFKSEGKLHLRSRNDNDFNTRYPSIVKAMAALPNETVIDGEIVALDNQGRPSFNALQNYGSSKIGLLYYVFDLIRLVEEPALHLRATSSLVRENRIPDSRLLQFWWLVPAKRPKGISPASLRRLSNFRAVDFDTNLAVGRGALARAATAMRPCPNLKPLRR